jgi:Leucine-rich repeat (LRR) protein
MFNRVALRALPLFLALLPILLAGCGEEETAAVELSEELELKLQFKAVEQLKEFGCEVKEVDDKWLGISGIMVKLAPEHFTPKGLIRKDVLTQFRHLINCFLILDRTPISDEGILPLREINNLRLLSVQQTAITNKGLSNIQGIVSLQLLRLNWTRIDDEGLKFIDRLPDLALLYLSGTKITDKSVEKLVQLKKLAALQFSHTSLTDKGIGYLLELEKLEYLGLDNTKITEASVPTLKKIGSTRKLVYLDITGTDIGAAKVKELTEQLPDCTIDSRPTLKLSTGPKPPSNDDSQ